MIYTAIFLLALLLSACGFNVVHGSGNITTESRDVSDFTEVDFSGFGEMTIVQGETEGLTIETDDNLQPYIKATVSGGRLTIGDADGNWMRILRPTDSIRYVLSVKSLEAVDLSGAGTVEAEQLIAENLALDESGAGKITIGELATDELSVSMSGAGLVELAGVVTSQQVDMSGLGSYEAGDLESQVAEIDLSGAGSATVWVVEELDASLSGAGSIRYYGSPQTSSSTSGVGTIQSLGEK
jgi:hypothetical protein